MEHNNYIFGSCLYKHLLLFYFCIDVLRFLSFPYNKLYSLRPLLQILLLDVWSRTFQNFISQADPETLAALGGGKTEGISADMVKTASNMISKMPPEELQRMLQLASSFQGGNTGLNEGSKDSSFSPGPIPSNVTPDMLKTASDMMSKMPAEEMQKMFEMASSLRGKDSGSATTSKFHSNGVQSNGSNSQQNREPFTLNGDHSRESSSSQGFLDPRTVPQSNLANSSQNSFPSSTADIQEQMRNQMKNPAMRQVFLDIFCSFVKITERQV